VFAKLEDPSGGLALRQAAEGGGDALFNKKQRALLRTALKALRSDTECCALHLDLDRDCATLVEQLVAGRRGEGEYEAARAELEAALGVPLTVVGSVATGLHLPGSDLDLCLPEGAALEQAAKRLGAACVDARVPVFKVCIPCFAFATFVLSSLHVISCHFAPDMFSLLCTGVAARSRVRRERGGGRQCAQGGGAARAAGATSRSERAGAAGQTLEQFARPQQFASFRRQFVRVGRGSECVFRRSKEE
jgi:hypothetical protein